MNDCEKTGPMLSEYIDGVLTDADASRVRSHLDECAACMEMHRSMKEIIGYMNEMEQVDPPAGFVGRVNERLTGDSSVDRVNERLKNDSPFGRIVRGIFYPLHIKVPIEIAGLAAAVVLIVYISGFVGRQGVEDVLPVGTGREVAERLDGVKNIEKEKRGSSERISEKLAETDSENDVVIPLPEEVSVAPSVLESTGPEIVYESVALPEVESAALPEVEIAPESKAKSATLPAEKSAPPTPEFAGTTQEILVEAPVKQIKIGDSGVRHLVTRDELQDLPVDDVVEALALKGGIVKTGDDLHVRGGSAFTDLPDIDSSPDSIMAELSRAIDMFGGRIIDYRVVDEKKVVFTETDVDVTRVRASRFLTASESSVVDSLAQSDSLDGRRMRPVFVIVPRSALDKLYMAILRIGVVRPVEMEQIAEEGDSVRVRIEFP